MKRARRMGLHPRHDLSNPTRRCVEATIRQGSGKAQARQQALKTTSLGEYPVVGSARFPHGNTTVKLQRNYSTGEISR